MLKEIPKATHKGNQYTGRVEISPHNEATKTATVSELGFNRNQVSQFQQMADHEEQVQEAVLDAEAKIGELTAQIPKATNHGANQYQAKSATVQNEQKPKSEALSEIGIPQHTAERFERLARHPEAEARTKKGVQGGTPCPGMQ